MTENEFLLQDRLAKIKSTIEKYGEDNFYISFSGGKDSTVLSALVDMACPGNTIPRVYADTGIELNIIREFVMNKKENDPRFVIIKPSIPIKKMLESDGYPFKSKNHSEYVAHYQLSGLIKGVKNYIGIGESKRPPRYSCPAKLLYQFTPENKLKISDKCCLNLKEKPLKQYEKESGRRISLVGIMREEGGRRDHANCMTFHGDKLWHFQPLVAITKAWENWFIDEYNIDICAIYKPPYNLERTGCKGCPFAPGLQHNLDILEKYFPAERKQCEMIWKPVYDEYRRIGYRLRKEDKPE